MSKKTISIHIELEPDDNAALLKLKKIVGTSKDWQIRQAIKAHIEAHADVLKSR